MFLGKTEEKEKGDAGGRESGGIISLNKNKEKESSNQVKNKVCVSNSRQKTSGQGKKKKDRDYLSSMGKEKNPPPKRGSRVARIGRGGGGGWVS